MKRNVCRILGCFLFAFTLSIMTPSFAKASVKNIPQTKTSGTYASNVNITGDGNADSVIIRTTPDQEGRYIKERSDDGKARYAYVYGKSYADAKQKLLDRRIAQAQNIDYSPSHTKYGDILRNWLAMSRLHIKESTYSRYVHLAMP